MFVVGLTGGIATGKSTVADMLQRLGCPIVDADKIAREVVEPGRPAWKKIRAHFGEEVIHPNGTLNRDALGRIVFADVRQRKVLNSIVHPEVYKSMAWQLMLRLLRGEQFVIVDVPLLYETRNVLPYLSHVILVSCDAEKQMERLCQRNELTSDQAQQRIDAQMPLAEKIKLSDFVIDNSGDRQSTQVQVDQIYRELRSSNRHWFLRFFMISVIAGSAVVGRWLVYKISGWYQTADLPYHFHVR